MQASCRVCKRPLVADHGGGLVVCDSCREGNTLAPWLSRCGECGQSFTRFADRDVYCTLGCRRLAEGRVASTAL
jgi:hypothetical protein